MKFKGEIELDIDIKDMSGDFMNAHELEYDNNRLYKFDTKIPKSKEVEIIKHSLQSEIISWLSSMSIGVTVDLQEGDS